MCSREYTPQLINETNASLWESCDKFCFIAESNWKLTVMPRNIECFFNVPLEIKVIQFLVVYMYFDWLFLERNGAK